MRAPVSVIIPTLGAAEELPGCLGALMEGVEAGLIRELVISDGGSDDATLAMARAAGAEVVSGPPGRGGQLRRGAEAAAGDWLLFLHADSQLAPGWSLAVRDWLPGGAGKAGYFRLAFRAGGLPGRLVAGWANLRARRFGLPYGDQGLLIHRDLYAQIGGFADIALMEDVAMARALRGRLAPLGVSVRTSAARYAQRGWFRQGASNLWRLTRYLTGADPASLAQGYRRSDPRS